MANPGALPSIPAPVPTIDGLMATVSALKMGFDSLSGQAGGNSAVRVVDLQRSVSAAGSGSSSGKLPGQVLLDSAIRDFRNIFDVQVKQIKAEIDTAREQAVSQLQDAIDQQGVTLVSLQDQTGDNAAAIVNLGATVTDQYGSLSGQITTVSAVAGRKRIYVQATAPPAPTQTPFDAVWIDTAHSNQIKTWNGSAWVASDDARIAANVAAITNMQVAYTAADSALASQIGAVLTVANGNTTAITNEVTARDTADTALGQRIDKLVVVSNASNQVVITDQDVAQANNWQVLGTRLATIEGTLANNTAYLTDQEAVLVGPDLVLAGRITSAQAQLDEATASGKMQLIAVASPQSGVAAEFSVNLLANDGHSFAQTGLRLRAMSNGGGEFAVQAGKFLISSGSSTDGTGTDYVPFEITANGLESQAVLNGNLIVNGSVTGTKLAASSVSADKIDATTLNTINLSAFTANFGNVTVSGQLRSQDGTSLVLDFTNNTISLPNGSITANKIAANSVDTPSIIPSAVTDVWSVVNRNINGNPNNIQVWSVPWGVAFGKAEFTPSVGKLLVFVTFVTTTNWTYYIYLDGVKVAGNALTLSQAATTFFFYATVTPGVQHTLYAPVGAGGDGANATDYVYITIMDLKR